MSEWEARMSELVHYGVEDQAATLILDSPHNRNALSRQLVAELSGRLAEAAAEPSARAVVITHTGRVFCAGADLTEAGSQSMAGANTAILALLTAIVSAPKPVIARITGHVRAGGMGIVGACDLALASETATFAFTEARIGVAPAMISLTTQDLLAPRAAARYYLTGATFSAPEAARAGLITIASSNENLDAELGRLLAEIRETSPQGAAETKRLLTRGRLERLAGESAAMAELSARLFASAEAQEGIHAFLEKRPPAWRASAD
jgi:enoyl-CoA hydratase